MTSRQLFAPLVVAAAMMLAGSGCQSCSHALDYSPPVANCQCDACSTCDSCGSGAGVAPRTGSAGGYGTYGGIVEQSTPTGSPFCKSCNQ